jgi:hypothetical protein
VRFRITHFFIVILLFALLMLPLSVPSVWWVLSLPAVLSLLAVFSTSKVLQSPAGGRLFWTAFPIGVAAYLAGVVLVAYLSSLRGGFGPRQGIWDEYVGLPLWKLIHGEDAFISNRGGILNEDFLSFLVCTHFVLAVAISSTAAFIAQVAASLRSNRHLAPGQ